MAELDQPFSEVLDRGRFCVVHVPCTNEQSAKHHKIFCFYFQHFSVSNTAIEFSKSATRKQDIRDNKRRAFGASAYDAGKEADHGRVV